MYIYGAVYAGICSYDSSADYYTVTILTGMNGPSIVCIKYLFPFPLASSQSYVNAYTFTVQIHVQRDRVTEVFPYFVSLIWFSDCDSGSQSIDACSSY